MEQTTPIAQQVEFKTEPRTGLLTNESWHAFVKSTIDNEENEASSHAIIFVDVDNFKSINDDIDHITGDMVIEHLARLIRYTVHHFSEASLGDEVYRIYNTTRHLANKDSTDDNRLRQKIEIIAGHTGGDEFALYCKTDKNGAMAVGDHLHNLFINYLYSPREKSNDLRKLLELKVDLSMGIGVFEPGMRSSEVLKHAEEAMYEVKNSKIEVKRWQYPMVWLGYLAFKSAGVSLREADKFIDARRRKQGRYTNIH